MHQAESFVCVHSQVWRFDSKTHESWIPLLLPPNTHKPEFFVVGQFLSPFSSPAMDSENLVAAALGIGVTPAISLIKHAHSHSQQYYFHSILHYCPNHPRHICLIFDCWVYVKRMKPPSTCRIDVKLIFIDLLVGGRWSVVGGQWSVVGVWSSVERLIHYHIACMLWVTPAVYCCLYYVRERNHMMLAIKVTIIRR